MGAFIIVAEGIYSGVPVEQIVHVEDGQILEADTLAIDSAYEGGKLIRRTGGEHPTGGLAFGIVLFDFVGHHVAGQTHGFLTGLKYSKIHLAVRMVFQLIDRNGTPFKELISLNYVFFHFHSFPFGWPLLLNLLSFLACFALRFWTYSIPVQALSQ